ncbi:hypothetical protein HK096_002368 [Nowakowskiella sp. JEL0078]|nr:hypothetical protein HK096_002368 [Nowakowskiella sp. JEL0078]
MNQSDRDSHDLIHVHDAASVKPLSKKVIVHFVDDSLTLQGLSLLYGINLMDLKRSNKLWIDSDINHRKFIIVPLEFCSFTDEHLKLQLLENDISNYKNIKEDVPLPETLIQSEKQRQAIVVSVQEYSYVSVMAALDSNSSLDIKKESSTSKIFEMHSDLENDEHNQNSLGIQQNKTGMFQRIFSFAFRKDESNISTEHLLSMEVEDKGDFEERPTKGLSFFQHCCG